MGRKRIIDQEAVLDAAERVIARDGAANLTIDAVAREAGITKASVLYDHKSKQSLIEAIVDRAFRLDTALHEGHEQAFNAGENAAIKARLAAAAEPPPEEFRAVVLNLSAALTLDVALRKKMQESQAAIIERLLKTSTFPRGAVLAYLALEGLKFLEHLDYHHFLPEERARLLREINGLTKSEPQEVDLS